MYFLFEVRFRKFYVLLESVIDKVCGRNYGRVEIFGICNRRILYKNTKHALVLNCFGIYNWWMDIVWDMTEDLTFWNLKWWKLCHIWWKTKHAFVLNCFLQSVLVKIADDGAKNASYLIVSYVTGIPNLEVRNFSWML